MVSYVINATGARLNACPGVTEKSVSLLSLLGTDLCCYSGVRNHQVATAEQSCSPKNTLFIGAQSFLQTRLVHNIRLYVPLRMNLTQFSPR